ncbi:pepsin/retropepsin-like aspartic protease family protein [Aestuariivivens sp. NBU2969]|uniref:pepsin/retropepsin-like aspartic protease family protein n=1 Tax=Aestuariivivens sp. NBU2969 TaxID=2873267 RepID=UPI001CC051D3|nr:pepsin/retropepsin-like aspartic protease family protein [Aestuariivivens sp. NBU2969]
MKNTLFLLLIILIGCQQPQYKTSDYTVIQDLEQLIEKQNYFMLKQVFEAQKDKLSKDHELYFKAIIFNVFNNLEESNSVIDEIINQKIIHLSDTILNSVYNTKLLNHINLYEYSEAALTSEIILDEYRHLNDSTEIETLNNELKIWKSLRNTPKQEIIRNRDVSFPMVRDKIGLFNVDVTINDTIQNFIFDTGANISVIKRSLIKNLGLTYIESDFYVSAFTGQRVDSDLAIAETLRIGELTFKNVVFLVLNDEDISFPQIDYYINGIIGFPVIEAMEEIRISKNDTIYVPQNPVEYNLSNFALDGLTPIIALNYKEDTLSFGFDTGARATTLYSPFYEKYKSEVDTNYDLQKFKSSGAGGIIEFEGYIIEDIDLKVGGSIARLKNLQLHKNKIGTEDNNLYGNLGQDFIKHFDEMIISFKNSSVVFK